jgi:hypothetical protein
MTRRFYLYPTETPEKEKNTDKGLSQESKEKYLGMILFPLVPYFIATLYPESISKSISNF